MPTYLPPHAGVSYSEAYAEAITVASSHRVLFDTIEMRHPEFRDEADAPYAIRVVADYEPLQATLESDAPMDAGAAVTFEPVPFELSGPDETDDSTAPSVQLAIDGVSRLVVGQLDRAVQSLAPVEVTMRVYASDDTTAPAMLPVLHMTLTDVEVGETRITARAVHYDPANRSFPRALYTVATNPTLAAR